MGNARWKPNSDKGPLAFLTDKDEGPFIFVYDSSGNLVATGKRDKAFEDGRMIYRFSAKGGTMGRDLVVVTQNGDYWYIEDGEYDYEGLSQGPHPLTRNGATKDGTPQFDVSTADRTQTGRKFIGENTKQVGNVSIPELLDPNLNQKTEITNTEVEFVDPIETLRRIAAENQGKLDENYITALEQAGKFSESYAQQLKDYLNAMSPYQQQLIAQENDFNQQERLDAAETAIPGVADLLRGEIKNAQTLANGKMLTSAEDLALEQTARSAGADAAWTRGLGDDSLVGRTLSNQLSVSQRQSLMQQGQSYLNSVTQLATSTLMDTPQKANLGSEIKAPTYSEVSNNVNSLYNTANSLTTMSPEAAQNSIVNQKQFQANMDYNTKVTNAGFNEEYIKRAIDIAASNIKTMNDTNQAILTDSKQTESANSKAKQMQYLEWLHSKGGMSDKDYEKYKENIEQGYGFDPEAYARAHGWSKTFWEWARDEGFIKTTAKDGDSVKGGETPPEKGGNSTTGGGSTTEGDNTEGGNTEGGNTEDTSKEDNTTGSSDTSTSKKYIESDNDGNVSNDTPVIHRTSVYPKGSDTRLIVQKDGTITIPDYNTNYNNKAYTTRMDYLSGPISLNIGGIFSND